MPRRTKLSKKTASASTRVTDVASALAELRRAASTRIRDDMGPRYGIVVDKALGVPMNKILALGKRIGHDHALALALWETGVYEARLLASLVDESDRVTAAQMDRWCRDFDNWGVVDTVCFKLFDRVDPALVFRKIKQWSARQDEFQRRAGFVLLACVALHNKELPDTPFLATLPLLERGAADERNFVKKAVSWTFRAVGGRNQKLKAAIVAVARRLVDEPRGSSSRWVGADVLKALTR